jgi:hypothetical protein
MRWSAAVFVADLGLITGVFVLIACSLPSARRGCCSLTATMVTEGAKKHSPASKAQFAIFPGDCGKINGL